MLSHILFSIVAVHGLGGDWEHTWTDTNGKLWLRGFVPIEIPNIRVISYGYNSKTAFSKGVNDIDDEAAGLLDRLNMERVQDMEKSRPIIFIAHSLGGIIVKKVGFIIYVCVCSSILYNIVGAPIYALSRKRFVLF